jgi:hypothetical protein
MHAFLPVEQRSVELQEGALAVLLSLCLTAPCRADGIAKGGLPVLYAVMDAHKWSAPIQVRLKESSVLRRSATTRACTCRRTCLDTALGAGLPLPLPT